MISTNLEFLFRFASFVLLSYFFPMVCTFKIQLTGTILTSMYSAPIQNPKIETAFFRLASRSACFTTFGAFAIVIFLSGFSGCPHRSKNSVSTGPGQTAVT